LQKTSHNSESRHEISSNLQRSRSPVFDDNSADSSEASDHSVDQSPMNEAVMPAASIQPVFSTPGTNVIITYPHPHIFDINMSTRLLGLFNISINQPELLNYDLNEMFKISHDVCYVIFNDQVKICRHILLNEFNRSVNNIIIDQSMSLNTNMIINSIKGLHEIALEKHILSLVFSKENLLFHLRKRRFLHENSVSRYNQYRAKMIAAHNEFQFTRMLYINQLNSIMAYEKTHQMLIKFPSVYINEQTKTINSIQILENKFSEVLRAMGRFP
jgi:hypothetical protein